MRWAGQEAVSSPAKRMEPVRGPLDILDHAAARLGSGGKLGFDATTKIAGEESGAFGLGPLTTSGAVDRAAGLTRSIASRDGVAAAAAPPFGLGRCVLLSLEPGADVEATVRALWESADEGVGDFVVAVDAPIAIDDWEQVFFRVCANTDPARDLFRAGGRVGVDATAKRPGTGRGGEPVRPYPPFIEMTREIRELVTGRWSQYGFP